MLTVNEIFHSIQGESTHAGQRCVFVRLTACDLRCTWCDTTYAFAEGRKMSVEDVVAEVGRYGCDLVEITGGEPLLQPDVYALMGQLLESGRSVLLETGGHISTDRVPAGVVKILDVKCPGSGEAHRMNWSNLDRLASRDEVKFVVRDRTDYEYARDVIRKHDLQRRSAALLLSPVHEVLPARELAAWLLEDRLPARIQLQMHKFIWDAATRGV